MSHTITLDVIHLTHQPRSSLGALIRRGLIIKFTSTLLKLTGDVKPVQNLTDAGVDVTFHQQI
jgi:hypothetical protein